MGEREATQLPMVQILARKKAEKMFLEMVSNSGLGMRNAAQQVFYFMPTDFTVAYEEMWYKGTAGKDGGGDGSGGMSASGGSSAQETAAVGKARVKNEWAGGKNRAMFISDAGAKRKGYKKYWFIADEEALQLKDRVDKRLRAIARDIRDTLDNRDESTIGKTDGLNGGSGTSMGGSAGGSSGSGTGFAARCGKCGRAVKVDWNHCPFDGCAIDR